MGNSISVSILVLLCLITPAFAERGHTGENPQLTDEERKIIEQHREKKRRQEEEARQLVVPSGLDTLDIDLTCRKSNILVGLRKAAARAEGLITEVKAIKGIADSRRAEQKLRQLCLKAVKAGATGADLMSNLSERRNKDRNIPRSSLLYRSAFLSNQDIDSACEEIVDSGSLFNSGNLESSRKKLEAALVAFEAKARASFNQAKGENSHKPAPGQADD